MSLLIKALEQAAKDRDNAKPASPRTSAPATPGPRLEPTIEPAPPPRSIPDLDPAPAPMRRSIPDLDAAPASRSAPDLEPASALRADPAPVPSRSAAPLQAGPSLEASAPSRPTPKSAAGPGTPHSSSTPAAARPNPALSVDTAAASRLAAKSSASMANIDAQHQRARAATVMQASATRRSAAWSYLTHNPVVTFGAIAGLAALGFGVYVYLQIAQPGLFARAPATRPPGNTASPTLPPPPSAGAPGASATPYATAAVATATSAANSPGENPLSGPALPPSVAASAGPSPAETSGLAAPSRNSGVVSAAAVIGAPAAADMPPESAPIRHSASTRGADLRGERGSAAPSSTPPAAHPGPPHSSGPTRAREAISITPAQQPRLNPALSQAYGALQAGNLEQSGKLYAKVAQSEPLNVDALLGMAYIAAQENRTDDAVKLYVRILELNPRHAPAQAALIGLMGRADPVSAETRVKHLIAQEPSPFLHFVLGNLYADQGQWAQAQQSYFQAHHLEPDNPDYAYNLAIALDHLSQSKLALGFYRRAEQLAAKQARANFNLLHARERITALSSKLE